ncbi:hypothetical protein ElyMa_005356100 [Elysia marginata]|uniref:BTB domain-containing protein n=1 Tax=Elysia marginata TaxID=1093978 RepID=A0AAV4EC51_9GAST|nr:hypothetical protein ElyMa_005356100 [Elysia marginata]
MSAFCPMVAEILLCRSSSQEDGCATDSVSANENSGHLPHLGTESFQSPQRDAARTVELNFSSEVVKCVLSAFYTGVLKPKKEFLGELLEAAEWLRAADLVSAIKHHAGEVHCVGRSQCQNITEKSQADSDRIYVDQTNTSNLEREGDQEKALECKESEKLVGKENRQTEVCSLGQDCDSEIIRPTNFDQAALDSLLGLKYDDSCIAHEVKAKETNARLMNGRTKRAKRGALRKSTSARHLSNPENRKPSCKGNCRRNDLCGCGNSSADSKLMVARVKKELTELKKNGQRRKVKPRESLVQTSKAVKQKVNLKRLIGKEESAGGRVRRKSKTKRAIGVNTVDGSLIEKASIRIIDF